MLAHSTFCKSTMANIFISAFLCLSLIGDVAALKSISMINEKRILERTATRRNFIFDTSLIISTVIATPCIVSADPETLENAVPRASTRLGGLLEAYTDTGRAFRMSKPLGWNKFDAIPGEYDVKFTDIINPSEIVTLKTTPVKSDTTLEAIGDAEVLGKKLASGRNMDLVKFRKRRTEGINFYDFEFSGSRLHEVRTLCVFKGKLWSLEGTTSQKNWPKRAETYKTIQESFVPRL